MWDQMKQAKEMYKLQKELEKERIEMEDQGVRVVVSGKMEVERVELNPEISKEEQEEAVKNCLNRAMKQIQANLVQKMQSMK